MSDPLPDGQPSEEEMDCTPQDEAAEPATPGSLEDRKISTKDDMHMRLKVDPIVTGDNNPEEIIHNSKKRKREIDNTILELLPAAQQVLRHGEDVTKPRKENVEVDSASKENTRKEIEEAEEGTKSVGSLEESGTPPASQNTFITSEKQKQEEVGGRSEEIEITKDDGNPKDDKDDSEKVQQKQGKVINNQKKTVDFVDLSQSDQETEDSQISHHGSKEEEEQDQRSSIFNASQEGLYLPLEFTVQNTGQTAAQTSAQKEKKSEDTKLSQPWLKKPEHKITCCVCRKSLMPLSIEVMRRVGCIHVARSVKRM